MENLVFDIHPITKQAYRVKLVKEEERLSKIPARVFQKLYDNLNESIDIKELLDYAYDTKIPKNMMFYRKRSLDTMMCASIKPFAELAGYKVVRIFGKSIMLIKEK